AAPSKCIDLLAHCSGFHSFGAPMLCNALPGIRYVPIELAWMQPMDHAPRAPAEGDRLFPLARSQASRALTDNVVDFVGAHRGDGPYLPITNPVALLRHYVGDQEHGALIVGPRSRCDFLEVCLALLVFAEEPIDRSVGRDTFSGDLAALARRV